jgi:pimeloyl-ACP methyl ester carboxylesterase
MPFASVNGIDLYYEVHGTGPTVVFAHGAGGNHASWYQQVPFFERFYEVVTFDHRGFGNSLDANGLGRGGFVDDLRGLIDHLGREKVGLVAQSMGGGTCMGFTAQSPTRVTALVMADTFGGMTLPEPYHTQQQERSEVTRGWSQLDRVVSKSLLVRDPARAQLYLQLASFNSDGAGAMNRPGTPAAPVSMERVKAASEQVPMLFVVGEEDALVAPEIIRVASDTVSGAEYVVVQDSGHSVYFEQPDVFNHVVHTFLSRALRRD